MTLDEELDRELEEFELKLGVRRNETLAWLTYNAMRSMILFMEIVRNYRIIVKGRTAEIEGVLEEGNLIGLVNHQHHEDSFSVIKALYVPSSLAHPPRGVVTDDYLWLTDPKGYFISLWLRNVGIIPTRRPVKGEKKPDVSNKHNIISTNYAIKLLEKGETVCAYLEGHRWPGQIGEFYALLPYFLLKNYQNTGLNRPFLKMAIKHDNPWNPFTPNSETVITILGADYPDKIIERYLKNSHNLKDVARYWTNDFREEVIECTGLPTRDNR